MKNSNKKELDKETIVKELVRSEKYITEYNQKITAKIKELEQGRAKWMEKSSELKEALKIAMRAAVEEGLSDGKYEDNNVSIVYAAPFQRVQIDSKLLKKHKPALWNKFSKVVNVSDSIKITIKN